MTDGYIAESGKKRSSSAASIKRRYVETTPSRDQLATALLARAERMFLHYVRLMRPRQAAAEKPACRSA